MPRNEPSTRNRILTPRKLTLLASTAVVGGALLVAGLGNLSASYFAVTRPAQAAEPAAPVASRPATAPAGFADLVDRVKPAVISVRVRVVESSMRDDGASAQMPQDMRKFFERFGMPDMPGFRNGFPQGRPMVNGLGSGFFISPDGYAVTNSHVIDGAKSLEIRTDAGDTYTAKVIGTDARTDLALIKVDAGKDVPYVKFADREARIGDWVIAVGNPFGLSSTVTAGIVSAKGRDIGNSGYGDYIQIDAPINKGNSGGPAFNTDGEVIGVNTAIFSPSGGSVGIGFDIPAKTVKAVVAQLKAHGRVDRAWLGVQVQPVSEDIADSLGLKDAKGAIVTQAMTDGPAAKAGIEAGDVITAVNGKSIRDSRELARTIGMMAPESKVKLDLLRKGEKKSMEITLAKLAGDKAPGKTPKAEQKSASGNAVPKLGLMLAPAGEVAGAGDKGVAVLEVSPDGPAAEKGFRAGDVILAVGHKTVSKPEEVRRAMQAAAKGGKRNVLMRVKNAEGTRFVAVPLGKA